MDKAMIGETEMDNKRQEENERKKEKISIIIDEWDTEDGWQIYRITDMDGHPTDFCGSGGFVMYDYNVDEIIDDARDDYDITIKEDYR